MSLAAVGQTDVPATNQPSQSGSQVTQYKKTSIATSQTADIEIYTAEGDKVTLSSSTQVEETSESYSSYANMGQSHRSHHRHHSHGGQNGEAKQVQSSPDHLVSNNAGASVSSTQKLSISVEGNLSQQELQDIQKALQVIQQASSKLQSGNMDGAQDKLGKLENLGSLASVSANVTVQKSVSVETGLATQTAA
jgi:hypothetical protein